MQIHLGLAEIAVEQHEGMASVLFINYECPPRGGKKCSALKLIQKRNIANITDNFLLPRLQNPSDRPPLTPSINGVVEPEVTPFQIIARIEIIPGLQTRDLLVVIEASLPDRHRVTARAVQRRDSLAGSVAISGRRLGIRIVADACARSRGRSWEASHVWNRKARRFQRSSWLFGHKEERIGRNGKNDQAAPDPFNTAGMVRARISRSSHKDQPSIYCRSNCIHCSKGMELRPLTCHK